MPIWKSNDEELILTEMGHDYVAFNIFSEELVVGIMLTRNEIEDLFIRNWKNISSGGCERKKQPAGGSFHLAKEFKKYNLENGWDTRVNNLHNIVMKDK